ncbi:D-alanyl-D-alanine carboxypeptidase/D-alanyl-D-alanine endopeptidase [Halpernia frigidisoli]|uniref:D-alanyl-D-alanine carboxypeptidase / D-alanyl-D-alanine-endopeptidase (Penicillin-binding protein 4) n=1 Tax=Halpernia frigidisoli TaxID=1125876 RepID=A0A1I3F502_9FLAO|nr:D-alanyl-D-alanine carboxypeptidase/D-alanyl-D-alanine-endopeptidase [Halpernia frigidisoli]SFI06325.1 D-alanyl-D-alanine carboxypeptidase / D-alanyl-D-alanine-endopeptidase (penicillin-binding protein 4) [Halpernia frigidisoli]
MKKIIFLFLFFFKVLPAQNVSQTLEKATKDLLSTSAALSANFSFYVADASGNLVYEYNGNKGLSTASTQKIFTAAAALETLGKNFTYKTQASFDGKISLGELSGNIFITSNGDPTLGSWRYDGFKPEDFKKKLFNALKEKNIKKIDGDLVIDDTYFDFQTIPGGWPWNDLGNYYGAGVFSVNWKENQFDINITGNKFKDFSYDLKDVAWVNELKTGGSSDQSLIFTSPISNVAYINGTLPAGKTTTVSGATPNPPLQLAVEIQELFKSSGIDFKGKLITNSQRLVAGEKVLTTPKENIFFTYESPTLDKLVYNFLRKSINLYGETFIKTMAKEKKNEGSFDVGVKYLKDFWVSKGIKSQMINFADGSGLSPQNYVSAKAEVQALLYVKRQNYFQEFYDGFPTQSSGMKMKSGTIKDSKSFAGYSKRGNYVFSIIINNYDGNGVSEELYKVLNVLK